MPRVQLDIEERRDQAKIENSNVLFPVLHRPKLLENLVRILPFWPNWLCKYVTSPLHHLCVRVQNHSHKKIQHFFYKIRLACGEHKESGHRISLFGGGGTYSYIRVLRTLEMASEISYFQGL
jgi:hypothetical protein